MEFLAGEYQVAVVGAGHAGIEAALAAARLGCKTVVFTINLDAVGNMPCNPAIGGTGKGHLVRAVPIRGDGGAGAARGRSGIIACLPLQRHADIQLHMERQRLVEHNGLRDNGVYSA